MEQFSWWLKRMKGHIFARGRMHKMHLFIPDEEYLPGYVWASPAGNYFLYLGNDWFYKMDIKDEL